MRNQAHTRLLGTLILLAPLAPAAAATPRVTGAETVVDHGDPSNRYDIVFVGDGFSAADQGAFRAQVEQAIERLRGKAPYTRYWSMINVHVIDVASNESGVSDRTKNVVRDTAFRSSVGERGLSYVKGDEAAINRVVARHAPDADAIVCIMNGVYAGVARGRLCYAGTTGGADTVVHELGHTIGRLADEYEEYGDLKVPAGLVQLIEGLARPLVNLFGWNFNNVTSSTRRAAIPWSHWIDAATPVPTPVADSRVGLFKGAFYFSDRFYRPKARCCMRQSADPHCEVCRETLALMLSKKCVPYRWSSRQSGADMRFSVSSILGPDVRVRWFVGRREVTPVARSVVVKPSQVGLFGARVRVEVQDASPIVRKDARRELVTSHDWFLTKRSGRVTLQRQATNAHRALLAGLVGNALRGSWSTRPARGAAELSSGAQRKAVARTKPRRVTPRASKAREGQERAAPARKARARRARARRARASKARASRVRTK